MNPAALQVLENAFRLLSTGPQPPRLEVTEVPGLPARGLGPAEVARLVESGSGVVCDAVWRAVVARARTGEATWIVIAAGLMLPELRAVVHRWGQHRGIARDDLTVDVLSQIISFLRHMDLTVPGIHARLCAVIENSARRHADRPQFGNWGARPLGREFSTAC